MLSHNSTPVSSTPFHPVATDGTLAPAAPLGQPGQSARLVGTRGPHSTGPAGTPYRQYCGRCDGSGLTEDLVQCPKCGGAGLVVNRPGRLDTPALVAEMTADYAAMAVAL